MDKVPTTDASALDTVNPFEAVNIKVAIDTSPLAYEGDDAEVPSL